MTIHSRTNNGAVQYTGSFDAAVDFFSKAGSLYKTKSRNTFYNNSSTALELFKAVWYSGQREIAMKLLFWLRDIRGGAGNRSGFADCVKWLVDEDSKWVEVNIGLIPEHGRWSDLRALFDTKLSEKAAELWGDAIIDKDVLASKWAKVKKNKNDLPLLKYLRKKGIVNDIGEFRRLLSSIRKNHIVESKMCDKNWGSIDFQKVPSVAMSRYTNAFTRNAGQKFEQFKNKVESGEATIKTGALFPHDCVRTVFNGDKQTADLQFESLPNYFDGAGGEMRVLPICDSSNSMSSSIGGSVRAIDVSMALGLYCSDKMPKSSPFHRHFMQFGSESNLNNWEDMKFSQACKLFNGYLGSTNIEKALDSILNYAKMFNATNDQIPNTLLILSDMQFDMGCRSLGNKTVVESCLQRWEDAGYTRPRIVYWDLVGYAGSPSTAGHDDVGLVSGFSPSILKSVLTGEDFTPKGIMLKAIEKYKITVPSK